MTVEEMRNYKKTYEVSDDECYMGNHCCASCMYAFPGNYTLDMMDTDVTPNMDNVCMKRKK